MPAMDPDELITRARRRCSRHRGPTSGCCRQCFVDEIIERLMDENFGMKFGEAHDLAWAWVQRAGEPTN